MTPLPPKLPVPDNPPDEGVMQVCAFNVEWLGIIVGLLEQLKNPDQWQSPPSDIVAQVDELIDLVMTNLD